MSDNILPAPLPVDPNMEGVELHPVDPISWRRQAIEERALFRLKKSYARLYDRFLAELDEANPDLQQRNTMAAAVLAMIQEAPTYRDAREGLKQLQAIFGHSVTKQETHNHLTLDARLAAGIAEAQRIGLLSGTTVVEEKQNG